MKRNIFQKAERILSATYTVRLLIGHGNSRSLIAARSILREIEEESDRLYSSITLVFTRRQAFAEGGPKKRGSSYERKEEGDSRYRCWTCNLMGTKHCINKWLDRPACRLFRLNKTLSEYDHRLDKYKKSRRIAKLKVPMIKKYSQHLLECKVCDRLFKKNISNAAIKSSKHYRKYVARRKVRLFAFLNYFGIKYREDYKSGWED